MTNFITNKEKSTLRARLNIITTISSELKFLVGFFYFSGWSEIVNSLKSNQHLKLKVLVGLKVCSDLGFLVEYADPKEGEPSHDSNFEDFLESLKCGINNKYTDTKIFRENVSFFIELICNDRLIIRKTSNPNHAKLYLFKFNEDQADKQNMPGEFITGSSNLTSPGLVKQDEFNVEIRDYGFNEANEYFDELWNQATPITDNTEYRKRLLECLANETHIADLTPFEAYCLIVKNYLETNQGEEDTSNLDVLLEKIGYKNFSYQKDAVNQALQIIKEHNGCIIADVVGLGKSVVTCMIARQMNTRGMIICPPGLIGDSLTKNSGWYEYLENFELHNWEVYSSGMIDKISPEMKNKVDIVVVDEAHNFRNEDTQDYENLSNLCRGKKVILLSATPFNNSPSDIFSLLKLFIVPGQSSLSLDDDLEGRFRSFKSEFDKLSIILKNYDSPHLPKRQMAEGIYTELLSLNPPIDITKVKERTRRLSKNIKQIISPVVIRRNRLDLKIDKVYKKEIGNLSQVQDPQEIFYYFDDNQNEFYDRILKEYFCDKGLFSGAIYQPYTYEHGLSGQDLKVEENRQVNQQRNLFEFMRRLLVKRFESSFGSFNESIKRFKETHELILEFIANHDRYVLDKNFIKKIAFEDPETVIQKLSEFQKKAESGTRPKNSEVYVISKFKRQDKFLQDIRNDINLFSQIIQELDDLKLLKNDPKLNAVVLETKKLLTESPKRKVIIFSEYVDTIQHLKKTFLEEFSGAVMVCDGNITRTFREELNREFNAQHKGDKTNSYKILLTSDKLSEGFNLNRAGVIINYDIPWNPTRVIQRVGRINRIGMKVFDHLHIFNCFPSVKGADIVRSRQISEQKMFLIHNALGEDAKILDADEIPSASRLREKISQLPEAEEELNPLIKIRNIFNDIKTKHPEVIKKIERLPARVKTAKLADEYQLNILRRKGKILLAQAIDLLGKSRDISVEDLIEAVKCSPNEPKQNYSLNFWNHYEAAKEYVPEEVLHNPASGIEQNAVSNLRIFETVIRVNNEPPELRSFVQELIKDIKNYHTLSRYTLRRLGSVKPNSSEYLKAIKALKADLGEDYLKKLLAGPNHKNKEIVIAVENVKKHYGENSDNDLFGCI